MKLAGQSVADIEAFREKYNYILRAIPLDELPKERTLFNHLMDEFEKCAIMKHRVEKARESAHGSHRRTCAWLWAKADLAIELAQQKRNRDEFDQDVKLKPAVRGTGKEAATSALPAETKKEKKKNKKGDKKGDQGQDKGGTPAAPAPKGKSPSNPKPPPPKSQNANKGDTTPSNLTPRSKAVSKTAKMSAVEKAKVPCMFYAYDACRAKSCAFLHSPTEKYTGPPPRALCKAKSPAAVAAVVPAVPSVPARNNSISWLWDTAAGRHLIGKQALNMHCVRKTNTPVGFATGGGAQQGDKSLAFEDSRVIPPDEQVYVLNECPPAQSIGKTVIDRGYLFIWDPRENVPYLVPPSEIGKCKLRVPRRSRINASRVVEYVPQYDEVVKPQIVDQAANLRPINVVGSLVKVEDDAVSLSDEESFIIDPCQDFPSPPQVPEEGKEQLNALIDDVVQEIKVASFTRNEKPAMPAPGSAASTTTCWSTSCTRTSGARTS